MTAVMKLFIPLFFQYWNHFSWTQTNRVTAAMCTNQRKRNKMTKHKQTGLHSVCSHQFFLSPYIREVVGDPYYYFHTNEMALHPQLALWDNKQKKETAGHRQNILSK